ncbi:kinase-like domain-containing protein [Dunaliella salina]|uniref:Kinase-like domain-containing protein n=2 Tax=Dunaliella salina TaxID=3046 RepID=A0ABQ7GHP2_DUNSA|nr:kinase-like domain-containing protein [Dunaliella salina]|eukprot:KAF5834125.1 kinase-like domain-containing protein [Dunaliella salina]
MPLALFAWMWTAAANSSCIIPLTDLAAEAWVETAREGLGLFYRAHAAPQESEQNSEDGNSSAADGSLVEGLQCHGLWLNFFDEMWDSVGDGGAATTQQSSMREIIMRMLHTSLANPDALSSHPAAAGPRFRLLKLALRLARSSAALSATVGSGKGGSANSAAAARNASGPTGWLLASLLLRDRAIQAGLAWSTSLVNAAAAGSHSEEVVHPVWGRSPVATKDAVNLLNMLCRFEADRLQAAAAKNPALQHLAAWAPGKIVEGLQLISSPAGRNPLVKAYAARCLDNTPPAEVAFYLPQLVQSLRNDSDGTIGSALLHKAQASDMFAHQIPILIAFQLEQLPHLVTPNPNPENQERGLPKSLACIFKVGDDVRQDVLALQVIRLLEEAFKSTGLPAYLCSYGCLPTGYERGIIEVVPNTKSRAGLGELSDKGLYDIFQAEFGMPGSPAFEAARHNFIASEAGYAIASFLLQAKDRHNGNLLISNEGHLVHIDFGFILEISPGGNMGFESAAFKLSHEMTQLLDPGANRSSATWTEFEELVVRGYLAARTVAEPIIATVALMAQSGLPCYSRGAPVDNLRRRFHLEMSEKQAAAFMRQVINDAYAKWTTGFYDYIQALQNRIPY